MRDRASSSIEGRRLSTPIALPVRQPLKPSCYMSARTSEPEGRLCVLIGSRVAVSHAAWELERLGSSDTDDEDSVPLLHEVNTTQGWPLPTTRAAARIHALCSLPGNVRHDLHIGQRSIGMLVGPRGAAHRSLSARTGCTIILLQGVGVAETANVRERTMLEERNLMVQALPSNERELAVARRTREAKLTGCCQERLALSRLCQSRYAVHNSPVCPSLQLAGMLAAATLLRLRHSACNGPAAHPSVGCAGGGALQGIRPFHQYSQVAATAIARRCLTPSISRRFRGTTPQDR